MQDEQRELRDQLAQLRGEVEYLSMWVDRFAEQAAMVLDVHPEKRQRAMWMLDAMARNWDEEKEIDQQFGSRLYVSSKGGQ